VTGLCPDHEESLEQANRRIHSENIKHKVADSKLIIHEGVTNLSYEYHEGVAYVVVYIDGSLYDRQSDSFCRAGWGAYFAPQHELNTKGPLDSRRPTTFRAELRAIYHILQHAACDIIIRCDCKGVVKLIEKILEGEGYDSRHEDADLLGAINQIHENIEGNWRIE
jgi:ribonuclease HI